MPNEKRAQMPNLGDLETAIMNVVWEKKLASVQDVVDALNPDRNPAYTTVMTVMTRLVKKGYLKRRKDGRSFLYSPVPSREKVAGAMLGDVVDRMYEGAAGRAIAHLLEIEEDVDDEELARLEALIHSKRKGRRR